ncbi:chemotaxis protein CheB [Pseudoxanthomonas sp.]|jgi:Chemotaxis response regulator containing a CheY-like receiver domain and a methylesterase domain|uniref:chemotaxis protein CheB n=1 Tax=Pseudoxanthomonas sp. TaxID=1871049 RepID=UPI002FE01136
MTSPAPRLCDTVDAIVVGASAGGVSAVRTLLEDLPANCPALVMIVLHLPRDRPSQAAELFAQYCALPVAEAEDKAPLTPGTVWIAPPDYHLMVEDRDTMSLSLDEPVLFSRPAIDPLFESAAAVFADRVLAILLTGASNDGSEGVAAIRAGGGQAWVQQPEEASSPMMPASALAYAGADAVLTLDQMSVRLRSFQP